VGVVGLDDEQINYEQKARNKYSYIECNARNEFSINLPSGGESSKLLLVVIYGETHGTCTGHV
jgi:hypothetical protein